MRLRAALAALLGAVLVGCTLASNAVDGTVQRVEGDKLFLSGVVTSRTPARVADTLAANPQIALAVLSDMDGALDDAALHRVGYMLRGRGIDTYVPERAGIYSGAVALFLAGKERSLGPGAVLGVHSWADGFGEGTSYPPDAPEHRANAAYTTDMLGSDAFYWFTLRAAPSDRIHVMSRAEIARFGLVTRN